jgi:hypothetical protein
VVAVSFAQVSFPNLDRRGDQEVDEQQEGDVNEGRDIQLGADIFDGIIFFMAGHSG